MHIVMFSLHQRRSCCSSCWGSTMNFMGDSSFLRTLKMTAIVRGILARGAREPGPPGTLAGTRFRGKDFSG